MFDFPNSPTNGQSVTGPNGNTFVFNSTTGVWGASGSASPLAIAFGGTGSTTAPAALTALGAVNKAGDTMTGTLSATGFYVNGHLIGVPMAFSYTGKPAASARVTIPITNYFSIAANLAGSTAYCTTNPTAAATFTLNKISGGSTTALGTVVIGTGGAATFSGAGGTLAPGDTVQMVAPGTQDGTLADLGITIQATRV